MAYLFAQLVLVVTDLTIAHTAACHGQKGIYNQLPYIVLHVGRLGSRPQTTPLVARPHLFVACEETTQTSMDEVVYCRYYFWHFFQFCRMTAFFFSDCSDDLHEPGKHDKGAVDRQKDYYL